MLFPFSFSQLRSVAGFSFAHKNMLHLYVAVHSGSVTELSSCPYRTKSRAILELSWGPCCGNKGPGELYVQIVESIPQKGPIIVRPIIDFLFGRLLPQHLNGLISKRASSTAAPIPSLRFFLLVCKVCYNISDILILDMNNAKPA